jgi:glycosyltransferase involved in cell wall biosynthesis
VTVITPSLNQGGYIEETIRSVLLQGYPNLEYIILDGGSTDQTLEIIRRYEPWISYWSTKKDKGQSAAINEGIQLAHGEYITWLNSDDVFLPGAIHNSIMKLNQYPLAGLIYGKVDVIDEEGRHIGTFGSIRYRFIDLLCMEIILPQQAAFIRKSIFDSIGYLREDLQYAMDLELFIRIGLRFDIETINRTTALFRLTNTSKGVADKANWCPEFIKIVNEFFQNTDLPKEFLVVKSKAFGGAYYRGAHTYLEVGRYKIARNWLMNAANFNRKYWLKPGWWKGILFTFLGKTGKDIILSFLTWLYVNRIYVDETNWQVGLATRNIKNIK